MPAAASPPAELDTPLSEEEPMRVLLIEDSEGEAQLLRRILESTEAVSVTWASELSEGITIIEEQRPDVVLTDLGLPDSDGLLTVEALRLQAEDLPVVVLTGRADENVATTAILRGAQDYLVKGEVEPRMLARSLRYAIERKRVEDRLRQTLEHVRKIDGERKRLLDLLVRSEEEERTRLAVELHDGPLQGLSAAVLHLSTLRSRLGDVDAPTQDPLASALSILAEEIRTLRNMMVGLHPPVLEEQGLESALAAQARRLTEADIVPTLETHVDVRPDRTIETILYRVAQESISNVLRHAGARTVHIELRCTGRGVVLRIRDDGVGFTPRPSEALLEEGHLGLRGMQERVEMAGGRWEIRSVPGEGTALTAVIPA